MPLTDEIRAMKIAPLGNFHDQTENLPSFYKNYKELAKGEFETLIGSTIEEIPNGKNEVIMGNEIYMYFDSESHVVMKNSGQSYHFFAMYKNSGKGNAVKVDLEKDEYKKTLSGLFQLTDPVNKTHVKGVFSSQFSSCGMQMAMLGGTKSAPEYIVISHLQNRSRLADIAAKLDKQQSEILGVFSIMLPRMESMTDAHYQLKNITKKSVVMIRDANLWPDDPIWYGFGMKMCGFIFEGTSLRLAMVPAYSTLFNATAMIDISRLPVFSSTPAGISNLIAECAPRRMTDKTPKEIKDYYFNLFKKGSFGDKFFVSLYIPQNQDAIDKIANSFYANFNQVGRATFIKDTPFSAFNNSIKKYITWQRAFSTEEIINGIEAFVAPDIDEVFNDMQVAELYAPAQNLLGIL